MADYEKQFQEDLEKAQALSLESLALEQFKSKRLQELNKSASSVSSRPKTTTGKLAFLRHVMCRYPHLSKIYFLVTRASSMTETDSVIKYDRQQSKSRPRPGAYSSGTTNSLIAPPPSSQRKNSTANDSPDLISFASPPTTSSNDIISFANQSRFVYGKL